MLAHALPRCQLDNTHGDNQICALTRVQRSESVQPFLELGRKTIIRLGLVGEEGVTASCWGIKDVEDRRSGWLVFVGNIGMPCHCVSSVFQELLGCVIVCAAVHQMDFWVALGSSTRWVNVQTTEIRADVKCFRDREVSKVLVVKYYRCQYRFSWLQRMGTYGTYPLPFSGLQTELADLWLCLSKYSIEAHELPPQLEA